VAALAAVEVGAVGLGTIVAVLATTAAADVTGILLASLLAALGFFVIPAKRRLAKTELREKIGELRESLVSTLRSQFEREIERSMQNINEAIAPYTRFVRAERDKLNEAQSSLKSEQDELERLKVRVDELLS
jgi:septal ring factor EnvC (AmiA/AmiB activator)